MNSSEASLRAPADWFGSVSAESENRTQPWPWVHLTVDQWLQFLPGLAQLDHYKEWMEQLTNVGCWVGVVGSVAIMVTVFSKRSMLQNSFYVSMLVVALLDLIFDLLKFFRWLVKELRPGSPSGVLFYNYASGVAYTSSLMSDMLTLALTLERYVALAAPIFHKKLSQDKKRVAWFGACLVSFLVSCTRMHYSFDTVIFGNAGLKKQAWFIGVSYFSDNVVPFLLTAVMLFLVAGIIRVLYKRKKQREARVSPAGDDARSVQEQARMQRQERDTAKTVSLLAALLVMYFVNQIGYMLYATGALLMQEHGLTYSSSYQEIAAYVSVYRYYVIAAYLSSPLEVFSRSLVFYTYVLFSPSFRNDFVRSMRQCGPCKRQVSTSSLMSLAETSRAQMSPSSPRAAQTKQKRTL